MFGNIYGYPAVPGAGGGGGGGGGGFGPGPGGRRSFSRRMKVFSPAFLSVEKPDTAKVLEQGDKVVLYGGLLRELHYALEEAGGAPLVFELTNESVGAVKKRTHVGVLEFSGEEPNVAYLPAWVMHGLLVEDGSEVQFRLRSLPPIRSLRLRPTDAGGAFLRAVSEPRLALEEALRSFTAVTEGDELVVHHNDIPYSFRIEEVLPANASKACSLFESDCELFFEAGTEEDGGAGGGAASSSAAASSSSGPGRGASASTPTHGSALSRSSTPPNSSAAAAAAGSSSAPSPHTFFSGLEGASAAAAASAGASLAGIHTASAPGRLESGRPPLGGRLRRGETAYFIAFLRGEGVAAGARFHVVTTSAEGAAPASSSSSSAPAPAPATTNGGAPRGPSPSPLLAPPIFSASPAMVPGLSLGTGGSGAPSASPSLSPDKPPTGRRSRIEGGPAGGQALGGAGQSAAASSASSASSAASATAVADIFVSTSVSAPSRRTFTWADLSLRADKCLDVAPNDPLCAPANDLGTRVFYASVEAHGGDIEFTVALEAVPAPAGEGGGGGWPAWGVVAAPPAAGAPLSSSPRAALISAVIIDSAARSAQAAAEAAASSSAASASPATPSDSSSSFALPPPSSAARPPLAPPPAPSSSTAPQTRACENCGTSVPERTYDMHTSFCRRNNFRCAGCAAVLQLRLRATHLHCPTCRAVVGNGEAELAKHVEAFHTSLPCEACGELLAPGSSEAHRATACPLRMTPCVYCKMPLPFRTRHDHEAKCGSRTVPCDYCGRLVVRKRLEGHQASGCTEGGSGQTPSSPFVSSAAAARRAAEALPEFALDGLRDAGALGLAPGSLFASPRGASGPGGGAGGAGGVGGGGGGGGVDGAGRAVPSARPASAVLDIHNMYDSDGDGAAFDSDEDDEAEAGGRGAGAAEAAGGGGVSAAVVPGAGGAGGFVSCPACVARVEGFDELQVHLIAVCMRRGTPEHREVVLSLVGPEAVDAIVPLSPSLAAVAAAAGGSAPASAPAPVTAAAAAAPAPGPLPARRRMREYECPCCHGRFAEQDDCEIHILTGGCPEVWGEGQGGPEAAVLAIRTVSTAAAAVAPPAVPAGPVPGPSAAPPSADAVRSRIGMPASVLAAAMGTGTGTGTAPAPITAPAPVAAASGDYGVDDDEEDEDALLARALAASMAAADAPVTSSSSARAARASAAASSEGIAADGLAAPRPPRPSGFELLAEGDGDGEAPSAAAAAAAAVAVAVPVLPPPSPSPAPAPAPARGGPSACECPTCGARIPPSGDEAADTEALHMHMLTTCPHAEENAARLFG
jgi:hypothetical protein